jgi:hypothetical protein
VLLNSLGARVGARAAAVGVDFRRPTLRSIANAFLALICLSAAAALFFGWLIASDSSRGSSADGDCTSLGRAGAHCVKSAVSGEPLAVAPAAGDCRSMGRAGRKCIAQPHE